MCDPKCHRRCIDKGILWRNNKYSRVIPPDSGIRATYHNSLCCVPVLVCCLHASPLLECCFINLSILCSSRFVWSATFYLMLLVHCSCTLSGYSAAHLPTSRQTTLCLFILRAYLLYLLFSCRIWTRCGTF